MVRNNKYTPAQRELVGWLTEVVENDGKFSKKAFQSTPTVISYDTESKSAAFDKL